MSDVSAPETFLLVSGDFVRTGGMDMANYAFAQFLERQGCELHIVGHDVAPELTHSPNVTWYKVPRPRRSTLIGEPMLRMKGHRVARKLRLNRRRVRYLVNGGNCPLPDINWVHYVHAATEAQAADSVFARAKTRFAQKRFRTLEKVAFTRARLLIANSNRTKEDILRHYQIEEELVQTIYYGTDPTRFYPASHEERLALRRDLHLPADKHLALFIGALGDRRKGFDLLFDAWIRVSRRRTDAELLVVGVGAELAIWKARAAMLPLNCAVRFLGFRRDVPELLRASDLLIAPTRYEAFGLAVQEALCCGVPVIVSRSAGVAEKIPKEFDDFLLSDLEDVHALTERIDAAFSAPPELKIRLHALANSLRAYTWKDMSASIYETIARVRADKL